MRISIRRDLKVPYSKLSDVPDRGGLPEDHPGVDRSGECGDRRVGSPRLDAWWTHLEVRRETYPTDFDWPADVSLSPQCLIDRMGKLVGPGRDVYGGGGAAPGVGRPGSIQYEHPGTWISSVGLGTMSRLGRRASPAPLSGRRSAGRRGATGGDRARAGAWQSGRDFDLCR